MKKMIVFGFWLVLAALGSQSVQAQKDIYEIRVFKMNSSAQMDLTENYLKNVYLPAMHRLGFKSIGVFKPIANDSVNGTTTLFSTHRRIINGEPSNTKNVINTKISQDCCNLVNIRFIHAKSFFA